MHGVPIVKPIDPLTVARLATEIAEAESEGQTIEQVVASAMQVLEVQHGGVTIFEDRGRSLGSLGASSGEVEKADALQHELREGPCVDAAVESRVVWSADLASDDRWPRWGPRAVELGLRSILSVELHSRERRVGALNLYGEQARDFAPDDRDLAWLLGRQVSATLLHLRIEHGLQEALSSRTLIGQAEGILMERFGIDADRAFEVLQRYSQDYNVKLREVAAQTVASRRLPERPSPTL